MNIKIELKDKELHVEFSDQLIPNQIYNIEGQIDFTELVRSISDINKSLKIEPKNFKEFKDMIDCNDSPTLKIVEYVYKILDAYIESYNEVYPEKVKIKIEEENIA